jgi:peptide/nickel transport system substrate-binding protein
VITWEGEVPFEMDQMVVEFKLAAGLTWSDGTPVGADDSVFSFIIASDAEAPGLQWAENRTETYVALDDTTIQWTGLPGFATAALDRLFWLPLPAHHFPNATGWSDLINDESAKTRPLSYGPFVLEEVGQDAMRFVPNPHYFRASEGLPLLDAVIFQEVAGGAIEAVSLLQSGTCDVLDSSFNLVESPDLLDQVRSDDRFLVSAENGLAWVQLVFGIQSAPSAAVGTNEEPALLGDVRTRQAIFACLDRETMLTNTIGDLGDLWPSFLPPGDSQLAADEEIIFDPANAAELLATAGWVDHDGDPATPLQAQGVMNVSFGTSLSLELLSSTSAFHQDLASAIQNDLAVCGIEVIHKALPDETLYAPGPEGPLFGRQFDLGLISWQPLPQDDCHLYDSTQIPSAENYWIGTNIAGLSDQGYDDSCRAATLALPEKRGGAIYEAERAYLDALPSVPLFSIPRVMVLPADDCESGESVTESEFFQQLEEYQLGPGCW